MGTLGLVLEPMASALTTGVGRLPDETLLMLDPNCRPRVIPDRDAYLARLASLLGRADIVKVSADDLAYMTPATPAIEAARGLVEAGAGVVLLTDGSRSVWVIARSYEVELPVAPIEVVDTVGSGDAFGGAFLTRWVEQGHGRAGLG